MTFGNDISKLCLQKMRFLMFGSLQI